MTATKNDNGKTRLQLIPVRAHVEIGAVFTFGAAKYSEGNWHSGDGLKWSRLIGALERHVAEFKGGRDLDPESGLHVLAHAGCSLYMLLENCLAKHGEDDRRIIQFIREAEDNDT